MTTTTTTEHQPFRAKDSLLSLQMSRGHWMRVGHELTGYYVPSILVDGAVVLIKTCCKESEPTGPTFPKVTRR